MAVQIAIIGCGGMANGHLNAYLTIHQTEPGKVEHVAMCDEVKERTVESLIVQTRTFPHKTSG